MKLYQIILTVPDDFNPEQVELRASSDHPVKLASEGFIGPAKIIECDPEVEIPTDLEDALKNDAKSDEVSVNPDGSVDADAKIEDAEEKDE